MHPQTQVKKKICLLGSYGVGKTSLVRRFVYNKFEEKYLSTIGVNISQKTIIVNSKETNNTEQVDLFIWDIANIQKFDLIIKNYLKGAHGAIFVMDITRPNTFAETHEFVEEFLKINPDAEIIFVGNKIDLQENGNFDESTIKKDIDKYESKIIFSSAKTGENVEALFLELGNEILRKMPSV